MKTDFLLNKLKLYLLPLGAGIFVGLASIFFVKPWIGSVGKLAALVREKEINSKKINEKLAVLSSRANLSEHLQALELAVPSQKDPIAGLTMMRKAVSDSGLSLLKLSVLVGEVGASESGKVAEGEIPYKMEIVGGRDGVISFLTSVYNSSPLLIARKLTMRKDGGSYSASAEIVSFYYSAKVKMDSAETPLPSISSDDDLLLDKILELQGFVTPLDEGEGVDGGRENPFTE